MTPARTSSTQVKAMSDDEHIFTPHLTATELVSWSIQSPIKFFYDCRFKKLMDNFISPGWKSCAIWCRTWRRCDIYTADWSLSHFCKTNNTYYKNTSKHAHLIQWKCWTLLKPRKRVLLPKHNILMYYIQNRVIKNEKASTTGKTSKHIKKHFILMSSVFSYNENDKPT